jgi:antitoxin component YwqK of YwqJK toxin-antitoxin module
MHPIIRFILILLSFFKPCIVQKRDKHKKIVEIAEYTRGRKNGFFVKYQDGIGIIAVSRYLHGRKNGIEKLFYPNCEHRIFATCEYKNGKKHGLYQEYFKNGNKKIRAIFMNDKLHGRYYTWSEDGLEEGTAYFEEGCCMESIRYEC